MMERLFELAAALAKLSDYSEMLRIVSAQATTFFSADYCAIIMVNPQTQSTIKTVIRGGDDPGSSYKLLQTNIVGWSMKHRKPFLSEDARRDNRFSSKLFADQDSGPAMCTPLISQTKPAGYILLLREAAHTPYHSGDLQMLERFALLVAPHLSNTQRIQEFFEQPVAETALVSTYEATGLLGSSPAFIELLRALEAAARCDVRVLLEGASGTGKELAARAIHHFSERKNKPFIAVDCGAIPENLIESELFGHVKGAFTGANQGRKGLFAEADGGTLFMDEIANLPYDMQAKLLRVLQQHEIRPVGSNTAGPVDVRVIAACSTPLRSMVEKGEFREDLFYRLHVYPIELPSLQQRAADIPVLASHFLSLNTARQGKAAGGFAPQLLRFMRGREWRGNIRELENYVERLVALVPGTANQILPQHLPPDLKREYDNWLAGDSDSNASASLQDNLEREEAKLIREALEQHNWNQSRAARALQISERTIRYKMEKLAIKKPG